MKIITFFKTAVMSVSLLFMLLGFVLADEKFYTLDTGDKIKIHVYGQQDLSLIASIDDDGTIVYPFLGEIRVKGITLSQLEKKISDFLKGDYLIHPNVHVSIDEYRPFYIQGQVNNPGAYPFQPGLTVSKAVSLSGGFTERAAKNKIYVIRSGEKNNKVRVKQHELLSPGDMVTVEESFF